MASRTVVGEAAKASSGAGAWPLERILFLLAGTMTGISAVLAATASPWFLLLTGFVAVNQLAFASIRHCGASLILERSFGLRRCGR